MAGNATLGQTKKTTNIRTYISSFSSVGVGCYGFKMTGFQYIATNELLALN